jgi:hypothetical protein
MDRHDGQNVYSSNAGIGLAVVLTFYPRRRLMDRIGSTGWTEQGQGARVQPDVSRGNWSPPTPPR